MQKEGSGIQRNTNVQGTLSYPFFLVWLSPTANENDDGKEQEKRARPSSPPFSPFSLLSKTEVESAGWMCTYQEVRLKKKTVEFILCSVTTVLARTKYKCIIFHAIQTVILAICHMSWIPLYLHWKLALHNINMKSQIHADNLNFQFVFT